MTDAWEDLATYRQKQYQKHYLYLTKGIQVNPKAYCCDDNTINALKPPVAILTVTPGSIYENENATWDLSASYDPDGGGLTYQIWDGIGGPFAVQVKVTNYPVAGRYEGIGVVTKGGGSQGQASTWLEVLSVGPPNPPEPAGDWRENIYLATNVNGIYYTEDFSGPGLGNPEWVQVITGLGTNNTRCIVGDSWDPAGRQYTRTTEPKIYRRTGGNWSVILDSVIVQARTGKVILGEFEMFGPRCNINAEGHVYVLVKFLETVGGFRRLYFFKSVDYGDNWAVPVQIEASPFPLLSPKELLVGAFQGTSPYAAGQVIYAFYAAHASGDADFKVSVDQGATWGAKIDIPWCGASGADQDFNRSPADQDVLYRVVKGVTVGPTYHMRMDKSIDRGTGWTALFACNTVPPNPQVVQRPNIYIWEPLGGFMAGGSAGLHWTENDWADYVTYTNADNFDVDGCSRVMDSSEFLYGWQGGNPGGGDLQHVIAVSDDRGQNWDGKAGNDPVTPSATSVPNTCGGVAGILQVWTEE